MLQCSQQLYQVSKEGNFLLNIGNSEYLGNLRKKGIHPYVQVSQAKCDGKCLAWLLSLKRLLQIQSVCSFIQIEIWEKLVYCDFFCLNFLWNQDLTPGANSSIISWMNHPLALHPWLPA